MNDHQADAAPAGVLIIDKPRGPTSHDVVAQVRRRLKTREVGHAGTLDPMATGVLIVAVGEATKLVPWLTAHHKSYVATIRIGTATTTLDAEGEVIEERPVDLAALERQVLSGGLEAALIAERARTEQVPPAVSAIKIDGVAAHARVRRGEVLEMAPRAVVVHGLEVTRSDGLDFHVSLTCGKGYYVRSLARDLSAHLGTVGHLTMLRRTASGPFTVSEASDALIPLASAAERAIGVSVLTDEGTTRTRHGKRLTREDFVEVREGVSAWLANGTLVAVGEMHEGEGRVLRGFRAE